MRDHFHLLGQPLQSLTIRRQDFLGLQTPCLPMEEKGFSSLTSATAPSGAAAAGSQEGDA